MASNLFTSLFNALSDPKSYYALQKEMNLKAVAETFFNSLAGKTTFDAVILPEDVGSIKTFDGTKAVRVRPIGIYDMIIPEPCVFKNPATIKRILALHPIAYPDSDVARSGGGIQTPEPLPFSLRVVECFYRTGPQENGKLRGLTYRTKTTNSGGRGINLSCLESEMAAMGEGAAAFDAGGYIPNNTYEVPNSQRSSIQEFAKKIKNSPSFSGWSGAALAGVIANAKAESAFDKLAAGDSVKFYEKAYKNGKVSEARMKKVRKRNINNKCSWGYWQLNICPDDGSGKQLADSKGIDTTTPEGKKQWVKLMSSDEEQFSWVSKKIAKILSQGKTGTDPYQAAYDITVEFERPVNKEQKGKERGAVAAGIYKEFKSLLDSPPDSTNSEPHVFGVDNTDDEPYVFGGDTDQGPLE